MSIAQHLENFLQLLVAQMKNQDPLNPMDGQEMAAQLAPDHRREVETPCLLLRGGVRQLLTSGPIDWGARWAGETFISPRRLRQA